MRKLLRVVTNSERSAFACQRKWWFAYDQRLTSQDAAAPLRQGSLYHQCLAVWYRSQMALDADAIQDAVIDPWLESREHYAHTQLTGLDDYEGIDPGATIAEDRGLADQTYHMIAGYLAQWGDHDRSTWEILAVEAQVARPFRSPITGKWMEDRPIQANGRRRRRAWVYGGSLDLLIRDRSTGMAWLVEHKTTSHSNLDGYLQKLHFDPQIRGYPWALAQPDPDLSEVKEPVRVAGVIYNVARKKVPSVPALLKPRTKADKEAGRSPGLSRAAIDTTKDVYLAAILEHGFDPDDYAEKLADLESVRFFDRETYQITEADLADFELDMAWDAQRMLAASKPGAYHPRQVQACTGPGAWGCPYTSLCLSDGPMARASYRVKTIRHAELTGDLAEPAPNGHQGDSDQPSADLVADLVADMMAANTNTPDPMI